MITRNRQSLHKLCKHTCFNCIQIIVNAFYAIFFIFNKNTLRKPILSESVERQKIMFGMAYL
jgi:hypothetical protein